MALKINSEEIIVLDGHCVRGRTKCTFMVGREGWRGAKGGREGVEGDKGQ